MVRVGVDLRHIEAGGRVKAVHAQIEQRGGAQLFLFFRRKDSRFRRFRTIVPAALPQDGCVSAANWLSLHDPYHRSAP